MQNKITNLIGDHPIKNYKIMRTIKGYAVFSIPTREGRIFAGMKPERVSKVYEKFDNELQSVLESFQMGGYYDEMIAGYSVRAVKLETI